ncbi:MAG TPA: hypothetical protein H9946_01065 [Candidatus Jeotgalibaca pullicola]|nr:hypothetical protein [Candidatus Jeotgalibaca pullicola]
MKMMKKFVAGVAILVLSLGIVNTAGAEGQARPIPQTQDFTTIESESTITPQNVTKSYSESTFIPKGETILGSYTKMINDGNGVWIGTLYSAGITTVDGGFWVKYSGTLTFY